MSGFETVFKIRRATLTETAPLRHAVYCDELNYECKTEDGNECDAHDGDSSHCIVLTPKDEPMGCVRVIRSSGANRLPFQRYCDIDLRQFRKQTVGEVSRLSILKNWRGECKFVLPAMYMGALVMAKRAGMSTMFIECEQKLASHIQRIGVSIARVSEFHEHNGQRAVYTFAVDVASKELGDKYPPLWFYVQRGIRGAKA